MKRFLIFFLCAMPLICSASVPQEDYIARFSAIAVSEMHRTGIPASITLAQGIVESAAGQSSLAINANNHFGIKCHDDWTGRRYFQDDDSENECFRVYDTPEESYVAHSDFLAGRSRYAPLFELNSTDYKGWAKGLSKCGYATDPKYASKLIKVIDDYSLDRFDREEAVPDAAAPVSAPAVPEPAALSSSAVETMDIAMTRPVYVRDRRRYVRSLPGETVESIAREYGLFTRELLRYNSFEPDAVLETDTEVCLDRQRKSKRR